MNGINTRFICLLKMHKILTQIMYFIFEIPDLTFTRDKTISDQVKIYINVPFADRMRYKLEMRKNKKGKKVLFSN